MLLRDAQTLHVSDMLAVLARPFSNFARFVRFVSFRFVSFPEIVKNYEVSTRAIQLLLRSVIRSVNSIERKI